MAQEKTNTEENTTEYKLVIEDVVVEKIAAYAAQKIDGIIEMKGNILNTIQENFGGEDQTKGVSADIHDNERASIDLSIILEYEKSATEVFDKIKRVIGKNVKDMTGLEIEEMTVHVVDVMTREEYKAKQQTND